MPLNKPLEVQLGNPFDYGHMHHRGSHLLRCCALCGAELEYLGETVDEAARRERETEPWEMGDGSPPDPDDRNRDHRLDPDDHDRCQC